MKKFILLILSAIMLISTTNVFAKDYSDYPQKFWDVPKTHWAYNYISELTDKGVISGYDDGSFKPESTVSRAEWSKLMISAAKIDTNREDFSIADLPKDHWAYNFVIAARDYMNWYRNGDNIYFKPNQAASREDVTVSLVKLKDYNVKDVDYSSLSTFKDIDSISNDLKKYVAVALEKNLISGFEDNTFRGQDTLTRAEAATLLCRAFKMGSDNKVVDFNDFFKDTIGTGVSEPIKTPTPKPIETPIPTPTPSPIKEPTPEPTPEPKPVINNGSALTPDGEVINSELILNSRYEVETLCDVMLPTPNFYTYDSNDNLYYFDEGIVRRINMITREKEVICDLNVEGEYRFLVPIEGEGYKVKNVHQLFCSREDNCLFLYVDLKNEVTGEIIENVLIRPEGNSGRIIEHTKNEIEDDIGNRYNVSCFIGCVNNADDLLYVAKENTGSYCHGMLSGLKWDKGFIMDPTFDQTLNSAEGYRNSGLNDSLLTTFAVKENRIYFATYNKLFRYDYHNFYESNSMGPESEFAASFVNERAWYVIDKSGGISITSLDGCYTFNPINYNGSGINILIDYSSRITDNKPLDCNQILPIFIVDSNEDFIIYDKLNSCFRILKRTTVK